jgi:AcrR family transcriptional regulator
MTQRKKERTDRRRSSSGHQNPRKDLLRKAVIDAAATLFAERGVGGVNFQDIASKLGISRPSIYYYFKSKEEILASLVEEVTVFSGNQAMQLASGTEVDIVLTIRQMVFNHARWILEHPIEFRVIDRSESDLPVTVRRIHERAKRTLLDNFTQIIKRGIEQGCLRPVDPRVTAFSLLGMCNWTAWWYDPKGRLPASDIASLVADLAVHAVAAVRSSSTAQFELSDALRLIREDVALLERVASNKTKAE